MKNNKFLKIILYISAAFLFLTGSFLLLGKTASANNITIKTYDGKTIIYTVDGVNSDSDSDEKEPRLCSICKKNECMEGQFYCEDCYNNVLNSESTIDFMLKMQKFQEEANEVQKQHAEEQAEEQAREKANDRKLSAADSFFLVMVIIAVSIFCVVVFHVYINGNSSGSNIFFKAYKGSESDGESENSDQNQSVETEAAEQEELKDISLVEAPKEVAAAENKSAKEAVAAENKIEPVEEKVLVKKNFEDCLKQQTTSFHSGDSFAVCIGENDELILMHYYSNSFNTVKVKVEDNGKLKVIHDFRRDHDFMVAIDYELGKDSLKFNLKSAKGNAVSFVLKPIVNTKINGYTINYDQTRDYTLITVTCLPNYINWIQQNAVLEEQKKKELTNQELREKVKNLDPEVRNKFMELAKNGKTNEAIKVCNEVTELGLKDAKRVIEYKLYY